MSTRGERSNAVKKLKNLIFTPKTEVKAFRQKMDDTFSDVILPNRVEYTERECAGVLCDVLSPEIYNSHRLVLYIHGGAFVGGSRKAYRPFVAALAHAVSCRAVLPEFRLAPTHPYPASLDDIQNVFRTLYTEELVARSLDNSGDIDKAKPEIIIMADGSGASIAMGLVLSLRDRFRAAIRNVILFSPWLDVSASSKVLTVKKSPDDLLSGDCIRRAAELYTYQDNREIPLVSPLKATEEQLDGFPPVYIQMGEKELLLDDAKKMQELLQKSGCQCELDVWPEMMTMFQLADEHLEESHLAIERIGRYLTLRKITAQDSQTEIQLELERKE